MVCGVVIGVVALITVESRSPARADQKVDVPSSCPREWEIMAVAMTSLSETSTKSNLVPTGSEPRSGHDLASGSINNMRTGGLVLGIAVLGTACGGIPSGVYQAGALSVSTHSAGLAARVCGRPTPGLAAAEVTAVTASPLARGDVGDDKDVELGTATAEVRGFGGDGQPCAGTVRFSYRALRNNAGKGEHSWVVTQVGPWIMGASPPLHAVTSPDVVRGDTREYRREAPGPWDIDVAVPEGRVLNVLARPTAPQPDDTKIDVEVRLDGAATLHAESVVAFVAPVTAVYTLRITPRTPVGVTVLAREGAADAELR
jgi:hypothetical protein